MRTKILVSLLTIIMSAGLYVNAQDKDDYGYSIESLKELLDLYSNRRVEIGVMLNDTDSIMLTHTILPPGNADRTLDIVYMMSKEELAEKIGAVVLDYCLEFEVEPSSKNALNFAAAIKDQLLMVDRLNRKEYRKIFEKARDKEEQMRNRILSRQQETRQKESIKKVAAVGSGEITGQWISERYGDVIRLEKTGPNLWQGYYVKVKSQQRRGWGYKEGTKALENVAIGKNGKVIYGRRVTYFPATQEVKWVTFSAEIKAGKIKFKSYQDALKRDK